MIFRVDFGAREHSRKQKMLSLRKESKQTLLEEKEFV